MTNLQNAILEACNDDVITTHEANVLLEGYYRIPFPIGINKDIANELRTEIKQLCRLAGAQAFAISVQTTNKKGKYPVHKDFDNGIGRMRGAFYLGSDDGNGGLDIVLLDSDQIYTKTNGNLDSKPISAIIHDILLTARKICGAPNPYMTYDGYAFFGSVDNISQMRIFQHCIDKPKKSEFMELGGVKLDDLFIESTNPCGFFESSIVDTIQSIDGLKSLKPASSEDITSAENELGLKFASDYKEYLSKFGAVIGDGIELTGIAKSAHRDVVKVTKECWDLNEKVPHNMYVIEDSGIDGIVIWQDNTGKVYQSEPSSKPKKIASSLSDYISSRLKT